MNLQKKDTNVFKLVSDGFTITLIRGTISYEPLMLYKRHDMMLQVWFAD
jgi:hypothetical protein